MLSFICRWMKETGTWDRIIEKGQSWVDRSRYITHHRYPDGYFSRDEIVNAKLLVCNGEQFEERQARFMTDVVLYHVHYSRTRNDNLQQNPNPSPSIVREDAHSEMEGISPIAWTPTVKGTSRMTPTPTRASLTPMPPPNENRSPVFESGLWRWKMIPQEEKGNVTVTITRFKSSPNLVSS